MYEINSRKCEHADISSSDTYLAAARKESCSDRSVLWAGYLAPIYRQPKLSSLQICIWHHTLGRVSRYPAWLFSITPRSYLYISLLRLDMFTLYFQFYSKLGSSVPPSLSHTKKIFLEAVTVFFCGDFKPWVAAV